MDFKKLLIATAKGLGITVLIVIISVVGAALTAAVMGAIAKLIGPVAFLFIIFFAFLFVPVLIAVACYHDSVEPSDNGIDKLNRLKWLQLFIAEHYAIDISAYTDDELINIHNKLHEVLELTKILGQPNDILEAVDDYTDEQIDEIGHE